MYTLKLSEFLINENVFLLQCLCSLIGEQRGSNYLKGIGYSLISIASSFQLSVLLGFVVCVRFTRQLPCTIMEGSPEPAIVYIT